MFQVIIEAHGGYVGCSKKLALQYVEAAKATRRAYLLRERVGGIWVDLEDSGPVW